jgi:hypothetical protein
VLIPVAIVKSCRDRVLNETVRHIAAETARILEQVKKINVRADIGIAHKIVAEAEFRLCPFS